MEMFSYVFVALVLFFLLIALVWRMASNRRSIPCPTWLGWMVEMDNPFTRTNRAATIIGDLDVAPGMAVLDVGCGPGRLTLPLARRIGKEGEVVALDIQEGMIRKVKEKAESEGLGNIRFVQEAVETAALEKQHFDRALLVTVLGEIPDQTAALRAIHAALKPGGILSVTEVIFDPHFQRRGSVTRLTESVGFETKTFFGNSIAYTLHFEKPGAV